VSGRATRERLAELVAEALRPVVRDEIREAVAELERPAQAAQADEWITARECARRYGFSAPWWRGRVDLYGKREGTGPRPRLMFSVQRIEQARQTRRAL
jgi:hypothetical protein